MIIDYFRVRQWHELFGKRAAADVEEMKNANRITVGKLSHFQLVMSVGGRLIN
jgi:hypothetical protein